MHHDLTHIRLLVDSFGPCFRFYKESLELHLVQGDAHGPYAEFLAGQVILALYDRKLMAGVVGTSAPPTVADAQDRVVLCFKVDDVDAAAARLQAQGVALVTEPTDRPDWLIRTAHVRAPDGTLVELNSPLRG